MTRSAAPLLTPLPVAGYQPQSQININVVNCNKGVEEHVLRILDRMQGKNVDQRWLAIARTNIEQGFMALNRAVFKPQRVKPPEGDA